MWGLIYLAIYLSTHIHSAHNLYAYFQDLDPGWPQWLDRSFTRYGGFMLYFCSCLYTFRYGMRTRSQFFFISRSETALCPVSTSFFADRKLNLVLTIAIFPPFISLSFFSLLIFCLLCFSDGCRRAWFYFCSIWTLPPICLTPNRIYAQLSVHKMLVFRAQFSLASNHRSWKKPPPPLPFSFRRHGFTSRPGVM